MPRDNNRAVFGFSVEGIDAELAVLGFTGSEGLSIPYQFEVDVVVRQAALGDVLRRSASLRMFAGDGEQPARFVHGVIHGVRHRRRVADLSVYRLELAPQHWLLRHRRDCRVFQDKSVTDIITEVASGAGVTRAGLRFALCEAVPPRDYCVQYRESDWDFIQRLCEEEGYHYYFEHTASAHVMVIGDALHTHAPLAGAPSLLLHDSTGGVASAEHVVDFDYGEQVGPGKFSARDYNFATPSSTLDTSRAGGETDPEVYEFPGGYGDAGRGGQLAKARLQALQAPSRRGSGRSGSPYVAPGFVVDLEDPAGRLESGTPCRFLLLEARHRGAQPQVLGSFGVGQDSGYENEFVCAPADVPHVPARRTIKPTIAGPQTAVVTGAGGEEIHTDEYGRVKVQFHWDRLGGYDEQSSCWVRVSQSSAGSGWGALWLPRVGHEVIVAFLDGDPDRPLITGSLYHEIHRPPYPLPAEKTKSTIKSDSSPGGGGSNELRFEDRKGAEEVYLHAQRDLAVAVEHDKSQKIGRDEALTVGHDRAKRVVHSQLEEVGHDQTIAVGHDHTETIGANMSLTVGASWTTSVGVDVSLLVGACKQETVVIASTESVGAAKKVTVGAAYDISVGGLMNESVGASKSVMVAGTSTEQVGKDRQIRAGKQVAVIAGKDLSLESGKDMAFKSRKNWLLKSGAKGQIQVKNELVIRVGQAVVTIKKNGDIVIKGKKLTIKASGQVSVKGSKVKLN